MKNNLKIRWIGQGGYLLWDEKTTICIDPYLSDVVNRLAGRARMVEAPFSPEDLFADAVICTHNHVDHVDIDAIPMMKKDAMTFYAPSDAKETLLSLGVNNYCQFDENDRYEIGNFTIEAVYACHSVPAIGVLIHHGDLTIYISGDTEYDEKLETLKDKKIDIMIICINGKLGNMNVSDAVKLTKILSPRIGIPTHYGMFESNTEDPEKYTSALASAMAPEYNREYCVEEILKNV